MPIRSLAAFVCAVFVLVLAVIAVVDVDLATRLGQEDGPLEWAQVGLCLAAFVLAASSVLAALRAGYPAALDVLTAAALAFLVIGETDLDKRVFGVKLIATRFFVNPSVAFIYRLLAVVVVVGPFVVLAVYAWKRRAELVRALVGLPGTEWGQVLIAGTVLFILTETFERPLGRVPGLPRNLVEEALEVVSAICFFLALLARRRVSSPR